MVNWFATHFFLALAAGGFAAGLIWITPEEAARFARHRRERGMT